MAHVPTYRSDLLTESTPALEWGCWYQHLGRVIVRERGAHSAEVFDVTAFPLVAPAGERPFCVRSSDGARVILTQHDVVVGFAPAGKHEQVVKLDEELDEAGCASLIFDAE